MHVETDYLVTMHQITYSNFVNTQSNSQTVLIIIKPWNIKTLTYEWSPKMKSSKILETMPTSPEPHQVIVCVLRLYLFVFSCWILPVMLLCVMLLCFCPPQRVTQASTKRTLETSSVQSALPTASATARALPPVTARGAFTGLTKIRPRWLVHVSSSDRPFVFTYNR